MRNMKQETPPTSVNGDDVTNMDEETEVIYLDDMDEVELGGDDNEDIDNITEQEDEDMEPPEDHALRFFKHSGSIFCCDLHLNGKVAVTGGEDDRACVWSVETGELIVECNGHKDSVIFVGFSFDGTYLATVDMSGSIKVWKVNLEHGQNQKQWTIAFEYETEDLCFGMWHFAARVLICGATTGDIYVFKIPSGETKLLQGHCSRPESGKLFKDGVRLAVSYEDGAVKVFDLKTSAVLHQLPASIHECRVTSVDTSPDNNLLISVSTNGKVVLSTSTNGKVIAQFDEENDMESAVFAQDQQLPYFALGNLNGGVSIWDVPRKMMRHSCAKSSPDCTAGVTKMLWVKNYLVTVCLDGSVRVYEARTGERSLMLTGHRSEILDLCYNAQQNIILTASDDGTARIFKLDIDKIDT